MHQSNLNPSSTVAPQFELQVQPFGVVVSGSAIFPFSADFAKLAYFSNGQPRFFIKNKKKVFMKNKK